MRNFFKELLKNLITMLIGVVGIICLICIISVNLFILGWIGNTSFELVSKHNLNPFYGILSLIPTLLFLSFEVTLFNYLQPVYKKIKNKIGKFI